MLHVPRVIRVSKKVGQRWPEWGRVHVVLTLQKETTVHVRFLVPGRKTKIWVLPVRHVLLNPITHY